MRLLLFSVVTFLMLSMSFGVKAQAIANDGGGVLYLFPNEVRGTNSFRRGVYAGEHVLGDTITYKLNEFEKKYIYFKPGNGAYAVEEKVTLKPQIYKAVKKMDSYFQSEMLKGKITTVDATKRFSKVLDIGLMLINFQTSQVEKDIKKIKDPVAIENFLLNLKFSPSK